MAGILSLKYAKVRIIFVPETISGIWNFYKINQSTENYGDLLDIKKKKEFVFQLKFVNLWLAIRSV